MILLAVSTMKQECCTCTLVCLLQQQ